MGKSTQFDDKIFTFWCTIRAYFASSNSWKFSNIVESRISEKFLEKFQKFEFAKKCSVYNTYNTLIVCEMFIVGNREVNF